MRSAGRRFRRVAARDRQRRASGERAPHHALPHDGRRGAAFSDPGGRRGRRRVSSEGRLAEAFLLQRGASHGVELLGILAFHASPVWVLAALADAAGGSRTLVREISSALKSEGLLDADRGFETIEQVLDGLEKTSDHLATTLNLPPVNVPGLRQEWVRLKEELRAIPPKNLPTVESLGEHVGAAAGIGAPAGANRLRGIVADGCFGSGASAGERGLAIASGEIGSAAHRQSARRDNSRSLHRHVERDVEDRVCRVLEEGVSPVLEGRRRAFRARPLVIYRTPAAARPIRAANIKDS